MRIRCYLQRLLVVMCGAVLVSCGGGSGGAPASVPPVPSAPAGQANLLIPQSGGSVSLADAGGVSATMVLESNGSAAPAPAKATTATTLPPEFASLADGSALSPQSVTLPRTPIWYLFFVPFETIHLPGLPGFDIALPENTTTAGKQFFIAFYDGHKWNYGIDGPGTVKGRHVVFAPTHTPLTLLEGVLYGFELYSQPLVSPITTTPSSLTLAPNAAKTFTVAETGYTGKFTVGTCTSNGATIATVSAPNAKGPSATVTVTAVASGTCTIVISDTYGQTASENVTVGFPPLTATPSTLTLTGNAPGTFTVSETGYAGTFTIGTCTSGAQTIATAAPSTLPGPSGTVTVTPVSTGSCTLAVSDTNGQTTNVTVTVTVSALTLTPSSLQFVQAGAGAVTQSVTVGETNYTGPFTVTPCVQGAVTVATLSPASIAGPSATLTVAPQAPGICTVLVSDTLGQSASLNITVTTASFTVSGTKRRL